MSSPPERKDFSDKRTTAQDGDPCPVRPTSPPEQPPAGVPTTTVMIYLAGDNNLSEECVYALTELKKASPPGGVVKVFAQYDPGDEFLPTQRYKIRFDSPVDDPPYPLARDFVDQYPFNWKKESKHAFSIRPPFGEKKERKGEGGTGDPRLLFNFIAYCVDQEPKTDHYVLIVCGHGAGINRDFLLRDNRPDGYLTIAELRRALRWMHERLTNKHGDPLVLEILGMDVCLMSMAEVTYELRKYVNIVIGSESYSPAAGWPYRQTVEAIDTVARVHREGETPNEWKEIARRIVKAYMRFYSDYWLAGLSVTMSALDVKQVYEFEELVRILADLMILELRAESCERREKAKQTGNDSDQQHWKRQTELSFTDALVLAHWKAQSYNGELYVDLADFCNCLKPYAPRYIAEACQRLVDFITNKHKLTIISCSWGRHYQYSHGVSIYFPWNSLVPYYGDSIRFPARSKWLQFLKEYVAATRREPRVYPPQSPPLDDPDVLEKILAENLGEARMGSDKMGSDKMGSDKGGNPIHSMRNPPIVFLPDPCVGNTCTRWHNNRVQKLLMRDVEDSRNHSAANDRDIPPDDDTADDTDEP